MLGCDPRYFVRMCDATQLQSDFSSINSLIQEIVEQSQGDVIAHLKMLRFLERVHQDIRELHFQPALPVDRHGLHNLLKEMEAEGGWPYIPKMSLRELLSQEDRAPQAECLEE
jgi:hypothetical protein